MKIVICSQQVGHYTGGRYFTYQVATNLARLGHSVTLVVDHPKLPFARDYEWAGQEIDVVYGTLYNPSQIRPVLGRYDLVIGIPVLGVELAHALASRAQVPVWTFIFDPPPLLKKYRGKEKSEACQMSYWNPIRTVIARGRGTVLVIAKTNVAPTREWVGKVVSVDWIYPAVNDGYMLDVEDGRDAIWISRIVPHKRFPHALEAIKPFNAHLNVFCSRAHNGLVKRAGMIDRVKSYVNQPDETKFDVLSRSSVLVFPSCYEGFGMPIIEAAAFGVPVVAYDFPTFREIEKLLGGGILFAKDRDDFVLQTGKALAAGRLKRRCPLTMDVQMNRLKYLLERYVR